MNNLLNELKFVGYNNTSSVQMKQGDLTPIFIELLGVKKSLKNTSKEKANLYLINEDNKVKFNKEFDVTVGQIKLVIDKVLPAGRYLIEVKHEGRIYPSLNTHSIQINTSADVI